MQNWVSNYPNMKLRLFLKILFQKIFLVLNLKLKIALKQERESSKNRKLDYISNFKASDQKLLFQDVSQLVKGCQSWSLKTGNQIIQTGNGITNPTFRPLNNNSIF